ncbi:MAG: PAS domain-containing protein [Nevskia sp.]|nr:PAS domain-containing protein [Nevskia sp.]
MKGIWSRFKSIGKRSGAATARIRGGLDMASTNVMIADPDLNIVYVNRSIQRMLADAEADIRKQLPDFTADRIVGSNIDVFHKNPAHQRGMLKRMQGQHTARIVIDGRTFSLILNPIDDGRGRRLGYVVEWT